MKRLLIIEWNKIAYHKTTRNFTIIYFLILILIGLIISTIKPSIGGFELHLKDYGTYDFPVVWENVTYVVAMAKIFLAVIIIANITNEYDNTTLKQNLIDGLTKKEFIKSKTMTNIILAIVSTIFVFVITLIMGMMYSKSDSWILEGSQYIFAYFIKMVLFFSLCTFLAVLLRKNSFAFLGLFVLWIIEGTISTIEKLVFNFGFSISDYLPLNVSSSIINVSKLNVKNYALGKSIFEIQPLQWEFIVIGVIYSVLFVYFSYLLLKKRDI